MVDGPLDRVKGLVSDVADTAWGVAGAVVGVAVAVKGLEMVAGSSDSGGDGEGSSESDE